MNVMTCVLVAHAAAKGGTHKNGKHRARETSSRIPCVTGSEVSIWFFSSRIRVGHSLAGDGDGGHQWGLMT